MMAARLPYLDREQVPPDVQAVYDTMKKATGRVLNTFRLMAHHASSVAPVVTFYGTLREGRSEEHTSELQSQSNLVCRLLLEKKKKTNRRNFWHPTRYSSSDLRAIADSP